MGKIALRVVLATCLACSSASAQDAKQVTEFSGAEFTEHPEANFEKKTAAEIEAYERDVAAKLKTLSQRKVCDLALVPPILNTNPLPRYDYDRLNYGMTIGIARTPKGRIWSCWVAGEDGPGAFFVLNRSEPNGETFSKPMLVINMHKVKNGSELFYILAGTVFR